MTLIRGLFMICADDVEKLKDAPNKKADVICLDIEDEVIPNNKQFARETAPKYYEYVKSKGSKVYVRVNGITTEYYEADVDAVVQKGLDGIVLPKTEGPEQVRNLAEKLDTLEKIRGIEPGSIKICCLIETALGVIKASSSITASDRVTSAILGSGDYSSDMNIDYGNPDGPEYLYARSAIAVACRAANVYPIDCPFIGISQMDPVEFEKSCIFGQRIGFKGRMINKPYQIDITNRVYAPTEEEYEKARSIVERYESNAYDSGAGSDYERPVYIRSKQIVERRNLIDEFEANRAKEI